MGTGLKVGFAQGWGDAGWLQSQARCRALELHTALLGTISHTRLTPCLTPNRSQRESPSLWTTEMTTPRSSSTCHTKRLSLRYLPGTSQPLQAGRQRHCAAPVAWVCQQRDNRVPGTQQPHNWVCGDCAWVRGSGAASTADLGVPHDDSWRAPQCQSKHWLVAGTLPL